jgi:hypothetical protein
MYSNILFAYIVITVSSIATPTLVAQSRELRNRQFDELKQDIAQLKRTIAEQDRRIAQLEKDVRALQISAVPGPIPSLVPAWHSASNWNLIKVGMSRVQIVEILGPPTREGSVMDVQTLYYNPGANSTSTLSGTITLVGDRLTEMTPPAFEK